MQNFVQKKLYQIDGVTYRAVYFSEWYEDETRDYWVLYPDTVQNFGYLSAHEFHSTGKELGVISEDYLGDDGIPTVLGVKVALSKKKIRDLTPKEAAEVKVRTAERRRESLRSELNWRKNDLTAAQAAVPFAVQTAEQRVTRARENVEAVEQALETLEVELAAAHVELQNG